MVCPGRPNIKDEVRRRTGRQTMDADRQTDRQAMVRRCRQPHSTTGRPVLLGGRKRKVGVANSQGAVSAVENAEMTDWSATTNHTTPHPHLMGGHHNREPPRPIAWRWLIGRRRPTTPCTTHTTWAGTSELTTPSEVGRTGAARLQIAAPTASAGGQGPSRGRGFGGIGIVLLIVEIQDTSKAEGFYRDSASCKE